MLICSYKYKRIEQKLFTQYLYLQKFKSTESLPLFRKCQLLSVEFLRIYQVFFAFSYIQRHSYQNRIECAAMPSGSISATEVKEAIKQMVLGKVIGADYIAIELWKVNSWNRRLWLIQIPIGEKSTIIPIWRKTSIPVKCSNYRVPDKRIRGVVQIIVRKLGLLRMQSYRNNTRFFCAHGKHFEKYRLLYIAFLHLRKMFDCMTDELIWNAL